MTVFLCLQKMLIWRSKSVLLCLMYTYVTDLMYIIEVCHFNILIWTDSPVAINVCWVSI